MKYQRGLRAVVYVAGICVVICIAGCGVSFCGMQLGGRDELVFSCGEELPDEASSFGQPGAQGNAASPGQSMEQGDGVSSSQPEDSSADVQKTEEPVLEVSGDKAVREDGRVNINLAGIEELTTLNGIGETRARAIIEYRSQNGAFTKAEDIMQVPGIKEGIFSKIQHQIAVD